MSILCEKHKPLCFADIKGQDDAIKKINNFSKSNYKKSVILNGPAGTGKTSLAYALAQESQAEILELNASDLRNKDNINRIIGEANLQSSLFRSKKILLIDEVDGITADDKGGVTELIKIIEEANFPIIMTSNNIWEKKLSELRKKAEIIEVKELDYRTIFSILKEISKKENYNFPDDLLKNIAIKSRGDARAAINDLQTINIETSIDSISERDKEEKIFNILKDIFKNITRNETISVYDKINMPLDEIFLWLEENIPKEYEGEELYNAFEALSRADVFRGRIHRQQHWRFLIYQNILLSAGVSSSKKKTKLGFTSYQKPNRILKIWMINQKNKYKKTICEKYASYCHIGLKRAMNNFSIIKKIINENTMQELKLNEEEIEFLKNT